MKIITSKIVAALLHVSANDMMGSSTVRLRRYSY